MYIIIVHSSSIPVGAAGHEQVQAGAPGGSSGAEPGPGVPARPLAVQQLHAQVEHHVHERVAQQHTQQVAREVGALRKQPERTKRFTYFSFH